MRDQRSAAGRAGSSGAAEPIPAFGGGKHFSFVIDTLVCSRVQFRSACAALKSQKPHRSFRLTHLGPAGLVRFAHELSCQCRFEGLCIVSNVHFMSVPLCLFVFASSLTNRRILVLADLSLISSRRRGNYVSRRG